jgi:hypothetical protein
MAASSAGERRGKNCSCRMPLTKTASATAPSWANVRDGRTLSWTPGIKQEGVDVRAIDINEIQRLIACNMDRLNTADMRAKACEPRGFRWLNMCDYLHGGGLCCTVLRRPEPVIEYAGKVTLGMAAAKVEQAAVRRTTARLVSAEIKCAGRPAAFHLQPVQAVRQSPRRSSLRWAGRSRSA